VPSLVKIGPVVLEKIFKWPNPIFTIISPLKRTWPFIWTKHDHTDRNTINISSLSHDHTDINTVNISCLSRSYSDRNTIYISCLSHDHTDINIINISCLSHDHTNTDKNTFFMATKQEFRSLQRKCLTSIEPKEISHTWFDNLPCTISTNVKLIHYQFWCTKCAFWLFKSLQ
jgi:hypothetical protein